MTSSRVSRISEKLNLDGNHILLACDLSDRRADLQETLFIGYRHWLIDYCILRTPHVRTINSSTNVLLVSLAAWFGIRALAGGRSARSLHEVDNRDIHPISAPHLLIHVHTNTQQWLRDHHGLIPYAV
jgi:hypothetical protein